MQIRTSKRLAVATLGTALLATGASAVEYNGQVRAGVGISDNIGRSVQNEVEEAITTVGFDFSASEQTNRMDLNIESQFDYIYYDSDTFDEEVIGGLNGIATFTLVDERLLWVIQDTFGQQLFDPFQPARPGNREDVNFFSTGPTLNLLPGSRNSVTLNAQYGRVDYETRPSDNDRLSSTLSLGREISRGRTLSLNFTGNRVEYDSGGSSPPMESYASYLRYEATGNRNTLAIDVGYNEVEFGGSDGDGVLLRVDWTQATSANGTLSISGGSRYSDQGNIFRFLQSTSPDLGDTADVAANNAPFLSNFFGIGYALDHTRYSLNAAVNWNQEDYKSGLGEDRDVYSGFLRLQREISRKVYAGANVRLQRREFKFQDRRDDDLTLGLELGYHVTSGFDVSFDYRHFQRNSVTVGADFTENRAFVRLAYTPVWSR